VSPIGPIRLRFGDFEADLQSAELFRSGSRIPIQDKPFRILALLLLRPGELVSRKQIFEEVWADTYVQEDQSLNTAMRKVRLALGDSPDAPLYIDTVGSRGYRFIYPVEPSEGVSHNLRNVRLAVLPCTTLGPEPEDHFSDGITEEMIARLGRLQPQFSVIAPASVMRYKQDGGKDIADVLRELAVDYILSCNMRRSDQRIRITTRLISGVDQSCIWSDTYDRDLTDIFAIQQEISEKIARSTMRLLSPAGPAHVTNTAAHEAYLRGRYFWNKREGPAMLKSLRFFREAIEHDPNYGLSYAGMADAYIMLAQHGVLRALEALPEARDAALKALSLDDTMAEAYVPLAWVKCAYDRDFADAEAQCRKALQINPSYSYAYIAYAFLLTAQGRHAESLAALKRALHIDPVSLPTNTIYASALYFARQYDAAIEQCRETLELDANFSIAHAILGQALEQKGMLDEAAEAFRRDAELAPWNPLARTHLARVCALQGRRDETLQCLEQLRAMASQNYVPSYFIGLIYAALGDADAAFHWLQKAEQDRTNWVLFLSTDPKVDSLRNDPRFTALLQKTGLAFRIPAGVIAE
jgi:TolB-like protein/tetratricopeptide (TPR) repeat protein